MTETNGTHGSLSCDLDQLELSPLSEDAMRVIQALQAKLQRTQQQLRDSERNAERSLAMMAEKVSKCEALSDRQQKVSKMVEKLEKERDQDLQQQQLLEEQLQETRGQLDAARNLRDGLVSREECDAVRRELDTLMSQLHSAQHESQELKRRLADAEHAQHVRAEARSVNVATATVVQRHDSLDRAARMAEAKRKSLTAVNQQKDRDMRQQTERVAQLSEMKEHLDQEFQRSCKHNAELEQRMEQLRTRNKQLEAQQRRVRELHEAQERDLRVELRRRSQQIKVLTDLLRDGMGDAPESVPTSRLEGTGSIPPASALGLGSLADKSEADAEVRVPNHTPQPDPLHYGAVDELLDSASLGRSENAIVS